MINNLSTEKNNFITKNNLIRKFENQFLHAESKYSIKYNPENNKITTYSNMNKSDFTDLNDGRNQIIFFEMKDVNSKDYYIKPRVINKKNISLFLNTDNLSKLNTDENAYDLNRSVSNNYNNTSFNNSINNVRRSIKSHSNVKEFIPEIKEYSIEKSFNIFILAKKKFESQSSKSIGENTDDFKRFRKDNMRKVNFFQYKNIKLFYFSFLLIHLINLLFLYWLNLYEY